jgi:hypothetical protein
LYLIDPNTFTRRHSTFGPLACAVWVGAAGAAAGAAAAGLAATGVTVDAVSVGLAVEQAHNKTRPAKAVAIRIKFPLDQPRRVEARTGTLGRQRSDSNHTSVFAVFRPV